MFSTLFFEDCRRYKNANGQSLFHTNKNTNHNYALLPAIPSEGLPLRFHTFTDFLQPGQVAQLLLAGLVLVLTHMSH